MKGAYVKLRYSPEEGHANYKYRLIMDRVTLALASGTNEYVPHTAYVTTDHFGNIHLVRPNEMTAFSNKDEVQSALGRDVFLDFEKLAININLL